MRNIKSLGGITVEGNTVQCLRLTDERTATGRRRQRVICTIDRWASELSAEARELLTEEEQAEWAFIAPVATSSLGRIE